MDKESLIKVIADAIQQVAEDITQKKQTRTPRLSPYLQARENMRQLEEEIEGLLGKSNVCFYDEEGSPDYPTVRGYIGQTKLRIEARENGIILEELVPTVYPARADFNELPTELTWVTLMESTGPDALKKTLEELARIGIRENVLPPEVLSQFQKKPPSPKP